MDNPEEAFELRGMDLMAKRGLDFETLLNEDALTVRIKCNKTGFKAVTLPLIVQVENINDNPPTFAKEEYVLEIDELMPINSSIGLIEATDLDSDLLYYSLDPSTSKYFRLQTENYPKLLVQKIVEFDVIQKMTLILYVQDTPISTELDEPSFTATTTIQVNVRDIDNRPPWFQPCNKAQVGIAKLCYSSGYKGRVNLTEKVEGPLQLQPGPVYAKDGDKSRNEPISYRILKGNEDTIFEIDENTGNITMLKAADIAGPITLTVLASQVTNRDQFAIASVTIEVMKKSRNPPRFEKERYEAYVYTTSGPDNMVMRDKTSNRPFRVKARDEDFLTGTNPDIRYEVQYSSYVNVTTDGFVVLKKAVKTESFALQLRAVDITTGESGTAALSVQVIPVPDQSPSDGYRAGDMALLGFIMAALLVMCLIVIGVLISKLRKGNANALKLSECLGPCLKLQPRRRPRDSMQFTNDGFMTEGGDPSRGGGLPPRRSSGPDRRPDSIKTARARALIRERQKSPCSSCGSNRTSQANHVPAGSSPAKARLGPTGQIRSILAKGKKRDERQKSVWFKESADTSEIQVEIIPDNIGLKPSPEEDVESLDADSTSSLPTESEMELGELTAMITQQDMAVQVDNSEEDKEDEKENGDKEDQ
ncbi:cadherin-related family member 5 isoform X2 [Engraulis encrasicolus]